MAEKLQREAETIAAEGWKWIEVSSDFAYGHTDPLRRLQAEVVLSDEEQATYDALQSEYGQIEEVHAGAGDLPEAVDVRIGEIETALGCFHNRLPACEPSDIARAGAFVSVDGSGGLKVERGFILAADEAPIEPVVGTDAEAGIGQPDQPEVQRTVIMIGGGASTPGAAAEEEDGRAWSGVIVVRGAFAAAASALEEVMATVDAQQAQARNERRDRA